MKTFLLSITLIISNLVFAQEYPLSDWPLMRVSIEDSPAYDSFDYRSQLEESAFFIYDGNKATYVDTQGNTSIVTCSGIVSEYKTEPTVSTKTPFWDAERQILIHFNYHGSSDTLWAMDFKNKSCTQIEEYGWYTTRFSFQLNGTSSKFIYYRGNLIKAFDSTTGKTTVLTDCNKSENPQFCKFSNGEDLLYAKTLATTQDGRAILRTAHFVYVINVGGQEPTVSILAIAPQETSSIEHSVYYEKSNSLLLATKTPGHWGVYEGAKYQFTVTKFDLNNGNSKVIWASDKIMGLELYRLEPYAFTWGELDLHSHEYNTFNQVQRLDLTNLTTISLPPMLANKGEKYNYFSTGGWSGASPSLIGYASTAYSGSNNPNKIVISRINPDGTVTSLERRTSYDLRRVPTLNSEILLRYSKESYTTQIFLKKIFDDKEDPILLATIPGAFDFSGYYKNSLGYWVYKKILLYYDSNKKALIRQDLNNPVH